MATRKRRTPAALDAKRIYGRAGLKQFAGRIHEEWDPQLRGDQARKIYQEMADSESTLGAAINAITALMQQVEIYVDPADDSEAAQAPAQFLEECLGDMETSWEDLLSEILTMLPYGWSLFEEVYKYRRGDLPEGLGASSRYSDNRIGWHRLEIRAQDTRDRWEFEEGTERLLGLWQRIPTESRERFVPIEKALLFRWRAHKNSPEGRSAFRTAKRSYMFKKGLEAIEASGIERDLVGLPMLQVPPDLLSETATAEEKAFVDELFRQVQSIRRDEREAAMVPAESYTGDDGTEITTGWKLSLLTSGGTRQVDADKVIQRHEHRMLIGFLAEFLLLGSGSTGSFALAKDKTDLFAVALTGLLESILDTLNRHAVPRLMRLNGWPPALWPTINHGDIDQPGLTEMGAYVTQLIQVGAIIPDDELEAKLRDYASLPAPTGRATSHATGIDLPALPPIETGRDAPTTVTPAAPQGAESMQATALNGAQVESAMAIVERVATGALPRDSGVAMLVRFFNLPTEAAEEVMGKVGDGFKPAAAPVVE